MQMYDSATFSKFGQIFLAYDIEIITKVITIVLLINMDSKHISPKYYTIFIY